MNIEKLQQASLMALVEAAPEKCKKLAVACLDDAAQLASDISEPAKVALTKIDHLGKEFSMEEKSQALRVLLCLLCLRLPQKFKNYSLPASTEAHYNITIERLITAISGHTFTDCDSPSEELIKDFAISSGNCVPGGSLIIELNGTLPLRSCLKSAVIERSPKPLFRYISHRGLSPCLRTHVDSRYTEDLTAEGRVRSQLIASEILSLHPEIKGLAMTTWYLDPAVGRISPHLAHARETPLKNGAFEMNNGPGKVHTERATKTSKTRRKLYEQGEYRPTCYTIYWPRAAMLAWHARETA